MLIPNLAKTWQKSPKTARSSFFFLYGRPFFHFKSRLIWHVTCDMNRVRVVSVSVKRSDTSETKYDQKKGIDFERALACFPDSYIDTNIVIECCCYLSRARPSQILWRQSWLSPVSCLLSPVGWVCPSNLDWLPNCILLLFQYTETDNCRLLSLFIVFCVDAPMTWAVCHLVVRFLS